MVLAVLLAVMPIMARAVPGDEHWGAQFGAPGVSNFTYAVAVNQGILYTAGLAPSGGRTNTPLNLWDGKQWSVAAVFSGPSPVAVYDLALVGNDLYAAGNFTNVNGTAAYGLARWDGANWSAVGFYGTGYALAVDGRNLYVGGSYTNTGSVILTNIGCWDGGAWHALGGGLASGPGSAVRALAAQNGVVYAGGLFVIGSKLITNLAAWGGSSWSGMGGGANNLVYALALANGILYAGGAFTHVGTTPASRIASWDGANWSALGTGLSGTTAVCDSLANLNGVLCVAGGFASAGSISATNFATWNGSAWAAPGNLNSAGNRAVASGGKLYVGGSFTIADGLWANEIAAWDGNQWSSFGTPGRQNGVQSTVTPLPPTAPTSTPAGSLLLPAGPMPATSPVLTASPGSRSAPA